MSSPFSTIRGDLADVATTASGASTRAAARAEPGRAVKPQRGTSGEVTGEGHGEVEWWLAG